MPMDFAQLEQMVTWLDEERRKDKEELARLRQRLEGQMQTAEDQLRRFQELDSRVTALQTQLAKATQLGPAMEQLKKEIVALVEQADQKWTAALRESDRARLAEREAQTHALAELRKEIEALPQIKEGLEARRAEEQRLNQMILELRTKSLEVQNRFEERSHAVRVREEQRPPDANRIAQAQETTAELLRRTENQAAKAQLFEDALRKDEQQIATLQATRDDLRAQQSEFMEGIRLGDQQRKRQMDDWAKELERYQKTMTDFSATMRLYKEFYDKNRHALESLETLQTHLSQRQAELAEMQRLSEERQKKQLQEWREENEKRSKQEALQVEYAWGEQHRANEGITGRLEHLEAIASIMDADLAQLWDELSKTASAQLDCLHKQQTELDEILTARKKKGRAASK